MLRVLHKISCFLRRRKLIKTSYYFIRYYGVVRLEPGYFRVKKCSSFLICVKLNILHPNFKSELELDHVLFVNKYVKLTQRSETVMLLAV